MTIIHWIVAVVATLLTLASVVRRCALRWPIQEVQGPRVGVRAA